MFFKFLSDTHMLHIYSKTYRQTTYIVQQHILLNNIICQTTHTAAALNNKYISKTRMLYDKLCHITYYFQTTYMFQGHKHGI